MRRLLVVVTVLVFSPLFFSQENPKYELFAGYSLQHNDGFNDGFNASGWEASGAYNFNRWIGMKLDVDGHYDSHSNIDFSNSIQWHTGTIGPQFSWRLKRATLFAHTLFGLSHEHEHQRFLAPFPLPFPSNFDASRNSFATVLGGGGDWNFGKRFAWRGQLDYTQSSFFGRHENHMRFSTGPVFRFGQH